MGVATRDTFTVVNDPFIVGNCVSVFDRAFHVCIFWRANSNLDSLACSLDSEISEI